MSDLIFVKELETYRHEAHKGETIDGVSVLEAAGWVDLSVPLPLPIMPHPYALPHFQLHMPLPVIADLYKLEGSEQTKQYLLSFRDMRSPEKVDEWVAKLMRGRFLLWRGWWYKWLINPNAEWRNERYLEQQIVGKFFPEGVWGPNENSGLIEILATEVKGR